MSVALRAGFRGLGACFRPELVEHMLQRTVVVHEACGSMCRHQFEAVQKETRAPSWKARGPPDPKIWLKRLPG